MKLYRGYKGWRKIPFLFKLFRNPYGFGYVDWIRWKWLSSDLYRFIIKSFSSVSMATRYMYSCMPGDEMESYKASRYLMHGDE